jgi:hypothetical protein
MEWGTDTRSGEGDDRDWRELRRAYFDIVPVK